MAQINLTGLTVSSTFGRLVQVVDGVYYDGYGNLLNIGTASIGTQGPEGAQGPEGTQGPEGLVGHQGLDGTQGPEGLMGPQGPQGTSLYTLLPTPKIKLGEPKNIDYIDGSGLQIGQIQLKNAPVIITMDLTQDQIDSGNVFIEMLIYKRKHNKTKKGVKTIKSSGYIIPSPWYWDSGLGTKSEWLLPWPSNFWSRSGDHKIFDGRLNFVQVNRPNHIQVTSINQVVPIWECLNGRFEISSIKYRDVTNTIQSIDCMVPISGKRKAGKNAPTNRFSYSPYYTPMYIAFRYVYWDSTANGDKGQLISGPSSNIIKISNTVFPFTPDYTSSSLYGKPTAVANLAYITTEMKCWMENSVP